MNILKNAIQCLKCNEIIISRHRHDYKSCYCKSCSIDGGLDYLKRSGTYEERTITTENTFQIIREHFEWGTYGKNGDEDLHYILLKDLQKAHLNNIIKTQDLKPHILNLLIQELRYREDLDLIKGNSPKASLATNEEAEAGRTNEEPKKIILGEPCSPKISSGLNETLKQRGSKYGTFEDNSRITQSLMEIIESAPNFHLLRKEHLECFHMIFHKIARAVCGDPDYPDNLHDIAGYAKLLEDILTKKEKQNIKEKSDLEQELLMLKNAYAGKFGPNVTLEISEEALVLFIESLMSNQG